MDENDIVLGGIIRAKRKQLGLTQTELANLVGSTTQCIYYYEKGLRSVNATLFFKICRALYLEPNEVQRLMERR